MCVCMWVHKHAFCTASPDQNEWVGKGGGEIRASLRDRLALHPTVPEGRCPGPDEGTGRPSRGGSGAGLPSLGGSHGHSQGQGEGSLAQSEERCVQPCTRQCVVCGKVKLLALQVSKQVTYSSWEVLRPQRVPLWWRTDQSSIWCEAGLSRV